MGAPDDKFVEIEFSAPAGWTDVTSYVDWTAGLSTRFGRSDANSQPGPASLTLTLVNDDARFTPGRQVLADNVTVNPNWPNVIPRRRIRYGYVIGSTRYYRFTGYISGWTPGYKDPAHPLVTVQAYCWLQIGSRVPMSRSYLPEILADAPRAYWPLDDAEGSPRAREYSGGMPLSLTPVPSSLPVQFGAEGPPADIGTSAQFQPTAGSNDGQSFIAASPPPGLVHIEGHLGGVSADVWVYVATAPGGTQEILTLWDSSIAGAGAVASIGVNSSGQPLCKVTSITLGTSTTLTSTFDLVANGWTHLAVSLGSDTRLYVDGALADTDSYSAGPAVIRTIAVGSGPDGTEFVGSVAQVALYHGVLGADRVAAHRDAGSGWLGEKLDERIDRYLAYAGVSSTFIDPSEVELFPSPQDGQQVVPAIQDLVANTESGGAVFYVDPNGFIIFKNRDGRLPGPPDITVDAAGDLDGSQWAPSFDDSTLVNSAEGTQVNISETVSVQTAVDQDSVDTYQLSPEEFTSYAVSSVDVLANAQARVGAYAVPAFRLSSVAVDLWTAQTAGLYAAVGNARLDDRLRVTNIPADGGPLSQMDFSILGWADTVTDSGYTVTFDTDLAGAPADFIWDDGVYGRWGGTSLLISASGGLTAGQTTVPVLTIGSAITTAPADYPLTLIVDAEQILCPAAPTGMLQTFSGVTRGINGTIAAPHADGAAVDFAPIDSWTF